MYIFKAKRSHWLIGHQLVLFRLLLFLIFFPRASSIHVPKPHSSTPPPSYRTALFIGLICIIHAIATLFISALVLYLAPQNLQPWANTLGILATLLAGVQFIPQLFTTWRLQAAGSLSIPAMCIQTPGSFVWAGSLAKRLGVAGWSTWGIYTVTGCLQGGVLGMCIYFEVRNMRRLKEGEDGGEDEDADADQNGRVESGHEEEEEEDDDDDDESTTLVGNER